LFGDGCCCKGAVVLVALVLLLVEGRLAFRAGDTVQ
jgi:hypothetical protein